MLEFTFSFDTPLEANRVLTVASSQQRRLVGPAYDIQQILLPMNSAGIP